MQSFLSEISDSIAIWHGFNIHVIRKPKSKIPPSQREAVLLPLTNLINSAFGTKRSPESIKKHAFESDLLMIITNKSGEWVSFSDFIDLPISKEIRVLYLSGGATKPAFQKHGLASQQVSLAIRLRGNYYTHIAARTQNEAVYVLMAKLAVNLYPKIGASKPSGVVAIEEHIVAMRELTNFDPVTSVSQAAYEGLLTAQRVKYQGNHPAVYEFRRLGINPENGDSVIVVGCLQ